MKAVNRKPDQKSMTEVPLAKPGLDVKPMPFDTSFVNSLQETVHFVSSILESSTEYSIIGKDLDGTILLWNEGACRLYGYLPEEVVGKANFAILHTPEDVQAGLPGRIMAEALDKGKWEGVIQRVRKNGEQFPVHAVLTPRRDSDGIPIGFVL